MSEQQPRLAIEGSKELVAITVNGSIIVESEADRQRCGSICICIYMFCLKYLTIFKNYLSTYSPNNIYFTWKGGVFGIKGWKGVCEKKILQQRYNPPPPPPVYATRIYQLNQLFWLCVFIFHGFLNHRSVIYPMTIY